MTSQLRKQYRKRVPERVRSPLLKLRRPIQESRTRGLQREILKATYPSNAKELIVILVPGWDDQRGGILAETKFYEESLRLKQIHESEVIMCTVPGEPLLMRYTWFKNHNYLFSFSLTLSTFKQLDSLLIHVPEYAVHPFLKELSTSRYNPLKGIKNLHLNILLQNIEVFNQRVSPEDLKQLSKLGKLTVTTAHERYSTLEMRQQLGFPLHRLSTYVSPELYQRNSYAQKENLLIISHDPHPRKQAILDLIHSHLPSLSIQVIKGMPHEEYKHTIARAKWALTFGEGLDGYFVETVFSGGVSFAVYNPRFFTEDFKPLRTIYDSYDDLAAKMSDDLKALDNETAYTAYQNAQFSLCHKYYRREEYQRNVEKFYKHQYTFP